MATFDYQTMDSNVLKALEASTRKKLIAKIQRTVAYSRMSIDTVRTQLRHISTAQIAILEYHSSSRFRQQEDVIDGIKEDPQSMHRFDSKNRNAYVFAEEVLSKPPISLYPEYARRISDVIILSHENAHDDDETEDDLRQIISIHIEYANALVDYFEEWSFEDSQDLKRDLKPLLWDTTLMHNGQTDETPQNERIDFTELDQAHAALLEWIQNERTNIAIVQFLLSPTFGSHGVSFIPETHNPVFAKILPPQLTLHQGRTILGATHIADDHVQRVNKISKHQDRTLQLLESIAQKSIESTEYDDTRDGILRWSMGLDQQDRGKGETTPSAFHHAFGEPTGSQGHGQHGQRQQGQHQAPNPNQSSSQQQPPTVPDDDDYEPDPMFARLARDITDYVKALPASDMTNDHMTRFSTTTESPAAISRDSLRDTDQRIVTRDRYGSRTYLVTYTRKSKKPIFSPVS